MASGAFARSTGRPRTRTQAGPAGSVRADKADRRFMGCKGKVRAASLASASKASASCFSPDTMDATRWRRSSRACSATSTIGMAGGSGTLGSSSIFARTTVLSSVYSARSRWPKSPARPMPELPMPPKGAFLMNSQCRLTQTVPARSLSAISLAVVTSPPQTEAPRPYCVLLARRMASVVSLKGMTGTTGPNCSSSTMRVPSFTPVRMVGG
mmetsp:Transcript_20447/g.64389  ORF Transcript_20447/g.64389 Transcript_20447/m.64389 type:complete len:211 (-) Transcript_20447:1134-1766(-)